MQTSGTPQARQHWMTGIREMRGSLWRSAYLAEARTFLAWVQPGGVTSAPASVRAEAGDPSGDLVDDFRISQVGPVTSIRNARLRQRQRRWPLPSTSSAMSTFYKLRQRKRSPARTAEIAW
jgi:hypothetical protein